MTHVKNSPSFKCVWGEAGGVRAVGGRSLWSWCVYEQTPSQEPGEGADPCFSGFLPTWLFFTLGNRIYQEIDTEVERTSSFNNYQYFHFSPPGAHARAHTLSLACFSSGKI